MARASSVLPVPGGPAVWGSWVWGSALQDSHGSAHSHLINQCLGRIFLRNFLASPLCVLCVAGDVRVFYPLKYCHLYDHFIMDSTNIDVFQANESQAKTRSKEFDLLYGLSRFRGVVQSPLGCFSHSSSPIFTLANSSQRISCKRGFQAKEIYYKHTLLLQIGSNLLFMFTKKTLPKHFIWN